MSQIITKQFLAELKAEALASRKCLERISPETFEYKPHEKSMKMGYLTLLVADVPKWIKVIIEKGEINFATWEKFEAKSTEEMLKYYDDNIAGAIAALENMQDENLKDDFVLKTGDTVLSTEPKDHSISSSINHWVHHRGQLTVYMRLNDIAVPSIYGPSADDKSF